MWSEQDHIKILELVSHGMASGLFLALVPFIFNSDVSLKTFLIALNSAISPASVEVA